MKRLLAGGLLAAALFCTSSAWAHHSAAGIDRSKTITVEGTVVLFKWANPHSYLELEVPNAKGGTDIWNLEMTSPAILARAGWKSTVLKAGDKVKATTYALKSGEPGGLFVSVTLPNGKTLTDQPSADYGSAPAK